MHAQYSRAARAAFILGTTLASLAGTIATAQTPQTQQQQQVQLTPEAMAIVQQHTIQVTPPAVGFTLSTKTVSVDFMNPGDTTVTVALSIEFGAPATNAQGVIVDSILPTTTATPQSLVAWVQGLPAQLTLQPHGKQTVTLTLNVPAKTKDGEYWGRIIAIVNNLPLKVPVIANGSQQSAAMNFNLRSVAPVFYRQGHMASALEITKPVATVTGNNMQACMSLHHTGAAHFEGIAHITLHSMSDGSDKPVTVAPLSVYGDMKPCLGLTGLPAGKYTLNISVDGGRQDIPAALRLPVAPVTTSVPFEIAHTP